MNTFSSESSQNYKQTTDKYSLKHNRKFDKEFLSSGIFAFKFEKHPKN